MDDDQSGTVVQTVADVADRPQGLPAVTDKRLGTVRVLVGWGILVSSVGVMLLIGHVILEMLELLTPDPKQSETFDRVALVGSLHVGLGMLLGFVSMFFGIAMTWLGIQEAF